MSKKNNILLKMNIPNIKDFPRPNILQTYNYQRKHSANPVFPPLKVLLSFA